MPVERVPCDAAALRARVAAGASVGDAVREVIAAVRAGGDAAVLELERRFGHDVAQLRVAASTPDALAPDVRAALLLARDNVTAVARAGLAGDREVALPQGQTVVVREVPVRRAGIYAPGGQAPYPSSIVMGVATARAARVDEVVVCASHPVMQAAAALCGADEVFAMGGAQAIAALAYGTESVAPVDVIVGPGSLYAQEAKRQVFGRVGIDGFAGPSDLVVIATEAPDTVLLDALGQAEHGAGSVVAVVSPSAALLDAVARGADPQMPALLALVEADLEAALAFSEAFAPEHLQLVGAEAEALAPRVTAAGAVFVGAAAGTAFGDYVAGSNHVLPTEGAARFASGLNVRHFVRTMAEVRMDADAAAALAPAGRRDRARGGLHRARRLHGGQNGRPRMTRTAEITRTTGETDVRLTLGLDGTGAGTRATGVGFFDHMLDLLARHGRLDLEVAVTGDLRTGSHHTVEDTGLVLGQALDRALGDRAGVRRYGHAVVPMDEARAAVALDLSGRPFCLWEGLPLPRGEIGGFELELAEEFFRAVASAARLTLHVDLQAGSNAHHMVEAVFKAVARALRVAVSIDPDEPGVPSTKGTLSG